MGSFNVACSISNTSIRSGEDILLFPLIPNQNSLPNGGLLIYTNCLFDIMTYPIYGKYDEYGGIKKIVEDDNTKHIENYFNMSIQTFCDIIVDNRKSITDFMSTFNNHFSQIKASKSYRLTVDEVMKGCDFEFISTMSFNTHIESIYHNKKFDCYFSEISYFSFNECIYYLLTPTKDFKIDNYNFEKTFIEFFEKEYDYYIHISEENQHIAKKFVTTSGMFVLKQVYDNLSKSIEYMYTSHDRFSKKYLEMIGFQYLRVEKSIDRYNKLYKHKSDVYFIGSDGTWANIYKYENGNYIKLRENILHFDTLQKKWKKLTGFKLNMDCLKTIDVYEYTYDKIVEKFKPIDDDLEEDPEFDDMIQEILKIIKNNKFNQTSILEKIKEKPKSKIKKIGFKLDDIYPDKTNFKSEFIKFQNFHSNCYSINKFWFPAMNGEQCGNYKAERKFHLENLSYLYNRKFFDYSYEDNKIKQFYYLLTNKLFYKTIMLFSKLL